MKQQEWLPSMNIMHRALTRLIAVTSRTDHVSLGFQLQQVLILQLCLCYHSRQTLQLDRNRPNLCLHLVNTTIDRQMNTMHEYSTTVPLFDPTQSIRYNKLQMQRLQLINETSNTFIQSLTGNTTYKIKF